MQTMKGYVYVLACNNGKLYVGSSSDVEKRVAEHNAGKTKSLRYILPVTLLYVREFETIQEARRAEYLLKSKKSRKTVEEFMGL